WVRYSWITRPQRAVAPSGLHARKPLRPIRRRITERDRPGQHLGNEPSRYGPEGEPPMAMAVGQPQPRLARGAAGHGTRIRKAGARANPGPVLDRFAEGKQAARGRQHAVELHRRRSGVAGGKFSAGGDADALLHWGETVAVVSI